MSVLTMRRPMRLLSTIHAVPLARHISTGTVSAARPRYRAALISSSIALAFGLAAGQVVMHVLVPPSVSAVDAAQDSVLLSDLEKRIDNEFTVKVLRGKCLGVTKALKGEQTGWVEVIASQQHSGSPGNGGTLMDHSLRGASKLGVERTFWSSEEQKLISVVWLGADLSGWPGVVHGGLLAAVLTEKLALANALSGNAGSARSTKAAVPQRLPGTGGHATTPLPEDIPSEPAEISIDYLKPTYAHNFHVIRVVPAWASSENVRIALKSDGWVATLETLEKQKVCVRTAATFDSGPQTERIAEKVRFNYQEFREWIWPSRQSQTKAHAQAVTP